MSKQILQAKLTDMTYVSRENHRNHPQLLHRHRESLELLYCTEGAGRYFVGGRIVQVQKGNVVICNPGVKHGEMAQWINDIETCCLVFQGLSLPGLPANTLSMPEEPSVLYFFAEQAEMDAIFSALRGRFARSGAEDPVCQMLGCAVLNLVRGKLAEYSGCRCRPEKKGRNLPGFKEPLIQDIIAWLDENLHEKITLEKAAGAFFISSSHLSHFFKKATGISPLHYVQVRRIGEAQSCLMNTSMSVGEIAEHVGFQDNVYFSRIFKKYTGVTPTQYRDFFRTEGTGGRRIHPKDKEPS